MPQSRPGDDPWRMGESRMPIIRNLPLVLALVMAVAAGPVLVPATARADAATEQTAPRLATLLEHLAFDEVVAVMQAEGLDYARSLDADLLGDRGGAGWMRAAERIYDAGRMRNAIVAELDALLPDDAEAIAAMEAFFGSDRGQRIIALENGARRALLDADVDAAARAGAAALEAEGGPLLALIEAFIDANDLIEANVEGGMNANFAFYMGLRESGLPAFDLPEGDMLADVWSQEEVIRADTRAWLLAYLGLAYRPLPDADLQAYIDFSRSPEGRALNRALFGAFNAVFTRISHDLGRAAGQVLREQDI